MVYYAHSMRIYGTYREDREMETIRKKFGVVFNPNTPEIDAARDPMSACLDIIASDDTEAVVFSTHMDHVGRGVFDEVNCALAHGKPVYVLEEGEIEPFEGNLEIVDPEDWRICFARAA